MKRLLMFLLALSFATAQNAPTPFDEPAIESVAGAGAIIQAVVEAKEHVFYLTPELNSQALTAELARLARNVEVYVVVTQGRVEGAEALVAAGVQLRTMPRTAEGLLLIDYTKLFVGGIITGLGQEATYVDLEAYGNDVVVQQLRGIWQAATPLGETPLTTESSTSRFSAKPQTWFLERAMRRTSSTLLLSIFMVLGTARAQFPDVPPGHYAETAVAQLTDLGIVTGFPNGLFRGQRPVDRYELSLILTRLWRTWSTAQLSEVWQQLANLEIALGALEQRQA